MAIKPAVPNYAIKVTSVKILVSSFASGALAPYFGCWAHSMKYQLLFSTLLVLAFPTHGQESASSIVPSGESTEAEECRVHTVAPVYPLMALRDGKQGTVIIEATVDAAGKVTKVKVVKSSKNASLDSAALTSVSSSTFCPGHKDGMPTGYTVIIPVRFSANMSG